MRRTVITLTSLALALGCDNPRVETDSGPPPADAGPTGTDSGPEADAGPLTDGNDTFATATALGGEPAMGRINPAGDVDYYSFTGTAGQWMIIATAANADDDPEMLDTVITLYDSDMNQIAENDDAVPRANTDSELITRLPADGTYYVLVQEFTTWVGEAPEGQSGFTYELTVAGLNASAAFVTVDSEPGNLAEDAQPLGFDAGTNADFSLLAGDFADGSDVDVFALDGATARAFMRGNLMPVGADGYGSTRLPSRIWLTTADGADTLAEIDPAAQVGAEQNVALSPHLPDGEYRLWLEHGGAPGANDFYVLKLFRFEDNPPEAAEATNGTPDMAEPLTLNDDMGTDRGFVLATLGDADTDHFSFAVADGDVVTAVCRSRAAGSGVTDLALALLDETGATEIATSTETALEPAFIDGQAVGGAGTYLIRITKASQSATVLGDWVRCGVAVGPPATP